MDTLGFVLAVVVTAANVSDPAGAKLVLDDFRHRFSRLRLIWADSACGGTLIEWVKGLRRWHKVRLEIVRRSAPPAGFVVQPHRWIVERTFGWFNLYRRLSKDYEYLPQTSEAMIHVTMIHIMARRLARLKAF